jgi:hypothetical protein
MPKRSSPSSRTGELRNGAHRVSSKSRQAQRKMLRASLETLRRYDLEAATLRSGSRLELELRHELARRFQGDTSVLERLATEVNDDYRRKFDEARRIWEVPLTGNDIIRPDILPPPAPPPAGGEFWWASTDWHFDRGIQAEFLSDGLHFFNFAAYDGDPLISFSTGAVAHFELHAARRPASSAGRWASLPAIDLAGRIEGFTGYWHWLLAADDKWAKCWLHLRQTAYQLVPHDFGVPGLRSVEVPVVLAERTERRTLIDEENNSRFVNAFMPGFTPMPAVEFGLVQQNLSVWVDLEVRFDMQLEGWSHLAFSPEPNPMGSVVLRHPQWSIQAL